MAAWIRVLLGTKISRDVTLFIDVIGAERLGSLRNIFSRATEDARRAQSESVSFSSSSGTTIFFPSTVLSCLCFYKEMALRLL